VEAGEDLSSAITKVGAPDFPEATTALIRAGSRSGETWRAIRDAMTFEYQLNAVRKGASKGLIAGIGSMVFAGVTTVASTSYMGPKLMKSELMKAAMQKGNGIHLEWVTTVGNIVGYAIGAILVLIFLMLVLASAGRKLMPVKADQLIMRIPYYKDLVLSRNNYIVLYGLSLLIGSGVRTEEALRLSATTAPPGALKQDLLDAEKAVKGGREWAKEMKTLHPTDVAALLSAQDRKQIQATLDTLANQYKELYAYRLASFVPALNMVAALFMSIAGGILFAESILPMLMATQNIM
jgi:general secretion pathway protein F